MLSTTTATAYPVFPMFSMSSYAPARGTVSTRSPSRLQLRRTSSADNGYYHPTPHAPCPGFCLLWCDVVFPCTSVIGNGKSHIYGERGIPISVHLGPGQQSSSFCFRSLLVVSVPLSQHFKHRPLSSLVHRRRRCASLYHLPRPTMADDARVTPAGGKKDAAHSENRPPITGVLSEKDALAAVGAGGYEVDALIKDMEAELAAAGGGPSKSSFLTLEFKDSRRFTWVIVAFASMGGLLSGLDQSLISGANLYLPTDLGLDTRQNSLVNSAMPLGAVGGALMLGWCNELVGRRWAIIISTVLYTIGAALEAGSINYGEVVVFLDPVVLLSDMFSRHDCRRSCDSWCRCWSGRWHCTRLRRRDGRAKSPW
jgi:hypothetical protein